MVVKHIEHKSYKACRECTELNLPRVHANKKFWSLKADKGVVNDYLS